MQNVTVMMWSFSAKPARCWEVLNDKAIDQHLFANIKTGEEEQRMQLKVQQITNHVMVSTGGMETLW